MSVCDPTVGVVTIFPTPRRNRPVVFATMSPPRVTLLAALLAATIASTTLACTSDRNDANGAATTSGAAPRRVAAEPAGTGSCDAVDPTSCLLPWPNDRFTRADPSTATGRRVDLELTIPRRSIVLGEPLPKAGQVPLWEALDGPSDIGHGGHGNKATPVNSLVQLGYLRSSHGLLLSYPARRRGGGADTIEVTSSSRDGP